MTIRQQMRVFLSLVAASVGVEICLYFHHFTLEWRNPGIVFEHRCGLTMVAAVAWMVFETSRVLAARSSLRT